MHKHDDDHSCPMCEGSSWDDMLAQAAENIERVGAHITGVFPTEDDGSLMFHYTAGFKLLKHPDLIVSGMPMETGMHVLNNVLYLVKEKGHAFKDGDLSDEVLQGLNVAFKKVHPEHVKGRFGVTRHVYGVRAKDVEALQVVWPDPKGKFPWDEDRDPIWDERQEQLWMSSLC